MKNLLKSKLRGDGEFITNLFTITVIIIMMMFFIDFYGDMKLKDNLDGIARKYILVLETTNNINGDAIFVDIDKVTGGDGSKLFNRWESAPSVKVTVEGSSGTKVVPITTSNTNIGANYGDIITLSIQGNLETKTGSWKSMFDNSNKAYSKFYVAKSSTAKH